MPCPGRYAGRVVCARLCCVCVKREEKEKGEVFRLFSLAGV